MSSAPEVGPPKDLPKHIGGYRVIRELGRGRMGPVVLARQWTSGTLSALRVLKPEWACLPRYVARLSRDAFAATHIEHPNLVRLDGFGEAQGRFYYSAEFIDDAANLGSLVKTQGALPAPQAIAHVLQAARALRFAHGQGLTHGDVRPESLLVDSQGVTRLADLGLSKTPASVDADEARETKGPILIDPEAQAEADAAPFRLDVRGLGLTLGYLLTGQEETHPTALISAGLPMNLVEVVRSMVEPKPGSQSADLGKVVPALERFLNARSPSTSPATVPREEDTAVLTECLGAFRASPAAQLRARIVQGAIAVFALMAALGIVARRPLFAGSVLGLGLMTALADFVVAGLTGRSALFPRFRALILESRGGDWLIGLAAALVFAAALVALNLHGAWLLFGALAVVLAAWLHISVDGKVAAQRRLSIEEAQALLKRLRLQGVSEETLRRFVRSTAGDDWEGFFEALFGFDAMLAARDSSERGFKAVFRGRSSPWRAALASWLDSRHAARHRERDRTFLQAIEERGLVAEGVNLLTARRKSRRIVEALLTVSTEIRAASRAPTPSPDAEIVDRPTVAKAVRQAAEAPENVLVDRESGPDGSDSLRLLDLLVGPRTRFLLGSALLVGFFLWAHQNEVVSHEQIKGVATRALESPDPLASIRGARIDVHLSGETKPLHVDFLPRAVSNLFHDVFPGAIGAFLVVSSLLGGTRAGLVAIPGAVFALLAPSFGLSSNLALGLGLGIPSVAIVLRFSRDW